MSDGIRTPFINIDELHRNQQEKLLRRYEIYERILLRCHNKIKTTANQADNLGFCFFEVPKYIYGTPLFDIKSCIVYMVNSLVKNGFEVRYTHPNLLFVSWLGKTNQNSEIQENLYQQPALPSSTQTSVSQNTNIYGNHSVNQPRTTNYSNPPIENNYKPTSDYKSSNEGINRKNAIDEIDRKILNIIKK